MAKQYSIEKKLIIILLKKQWPIRACVKNYGRIRIGAHLRSTTGFYHALIIYTLFTIFYVLFGSIFKNILLRDHETRVSEKLRVYESRRTPKLAHNTPKIPTPRIIVKCSYINSTVKWKGFWSSERSLICSVHLSSSFLAKYSSTVNSEVRCLRAMHRISAEGIIHESETELWPALFDASCNEHWAVVRASRCEHYS